MPQVAVGLLAPAVQAVVETELLAITLAMLAALLAQLIEAVAVVAENTQTIQI
jgi:hypothetical protein